MPDRVRKARYRYIMVPNRAGQGEAVLRAMAEEDVSLLAYTGFPSDRRKAQLDFIAEDNAGLRRVAKKNGWRISDAKKCFVIQGEDRVGAVHRHLAKLARERISVTAADAVAAGKGRYGMVLWVKPRDYARAARVLGAR